MIKRTALLLLLIINAGLSFGQYWQQKVSYSMEIEFDDQDHRYTGKQVLKYYNNSPDTLFKVYYHLFNNAFQPGSMMDLHNRSLEDPNQQMLNIEEMGPDEIGYLKVGSLQQNGQDLVYKEQGSILKVQLAKPLLPGKKTTFIMEFEGQVPLQTRRSGRDSKEGIAYSMSQWYPKLCEYDRSGWHADPYIGREFYGVWGDFEVKINIDADFILGGTGKVMNPKSVKHGYGGYEGKAETERVNWHFKANNVHDFMWAADKNYLHKRVQVGEDLEVHLLYLNDSIYNPNWEALASNIPRLFNFVNKRYGKYDFDSYSIMQGGDRGMEYPMATLVTGNRSEASLLGVVVHELLHAWYYMALATNENAYPWMDEGFTSYTDDVVMNYMLRNDSNSVPDYKHAKKRALQLLKDDRDEMMSTPSNLYASNLAYGINAYNKGAMYLHQLAYIIGQENVDKSLRRYYNEWKYKHPEPNDFILVAEKVSGMELHWYNDYFLYSDKKIDYAIGSIYGNRTETTVILENLGDFIMPVDVEVELVNGEFYLYNIPLHLMRANKNNPGHSNFSVLTSWNWVEKEYALKLPFSVNEIVSIEIDPTFNTLDIDRDNNLYLLNIPEDTEIFIDK